jgi:fatty acid hydroxylase family protein
VRAFPVAPKMCTDARELRDALGWWGAARTFWSFPTPRLLGCSLATWLGMRLVLADPRPADLAILLGIAAYWPVQEWFVHAFVLHLRPRTVLGWRFDPLFARVHRWHHRYPHVLERVFVPWPIVAALTPLNVAFWWLVTGSPARMVTGIAGLTAATLVYEWVHFVAHVPVPPRSAYVRAIRRHHALHHFRNEHYWHAFTVPWLDRWLGTAPETEGDAPRSDTVRTLGVDDPF